MHDGVNVTYDDTCMNVDTDYGNTDTNTDDAADCGINTCDGICTGDDVGYGESDNTVNAGGNVAVTGSDYLPDHVAGDVWNCDDDTSHLHSRHHDRITIV